MLEPTAETWVFWGVFAFCLFALIANIRPDQADRPKKAVRLPGVGAASRPGVLATVGLWVTIAAPVALLVLVPVTAESDRNVFNDLRLELEAVEIDGDLLSRTGVSFGGGPDDEFQIEQAPAGLMELRGDGDILNLTFRDASLGDQAWVVELETVERFSRRSTLHGSIPLAPGDGICVSRCEAGSGSWATLVQEGHTRRLEVMSRQRRGPVLIRRPTPVLSNDFLSGWLGRAYAPSQRIFPLRDVLPEAACAPGSGCDVETLRSFFWDSSEGLQLIVLDPTVLIDSQGQVRQVQPNLPPLRLAAGTRLSIWGVDLAPPGFDVSSRDDVASRLRGRTRFWINQAQGGATIELPDARGLALRRRDIARELSNTDSDRLSSGGMGDANAQLSFPELGGMAAGGAQGGLYVPGGLLDNRAISTIEIESRREGIFQREHIRLGRYFDFQDAGARPVFTLTQERLPWPLIGLAVSGWLVLVLCQFRLWRTARVTWMLSTGVQLLLALRFVVAMEAAYMDLTVDPAVRLLEATLAFLVGGGVMALIAPAHQRKIAGLIAISLVIVATWVHGLAQGTVLGWRQMLPAILFLVAVALVTWRGRDRKSEPHPKAASWFAARWSRLQIQAVDLARGIGRRLPHGINVPIWLWLLASVVALRLLLAVGGVREREGIALSAIYLPVMLLFAALMLRRALDGPRATRWNLDWFCCLGILLGSVWALVGIVVFGPGASPIWIGYQTAMALLIVVTGVTLVRHRVGVLKAGKDGGAIPPIAWWGGWCFVAVLSLMGVVVPGLVRDAGFAPLILAPLGVAAGIGLRKPRTKSVRALRPAWAWLAPLIFCLGLLGLPKAVAMVSDESAQIIAAGQAESPEAALSVLERSVGLTQNPLRILLLSDPEQARQTGTSQAESLSSWSSYLEDFTREPFGHGFLADVYLGPLAENHQDDNLSAVHLMSPYGRLGALLFVAWLGTLAACVARARLESESGWCQAWSKRDLLGLFVLWTPFAMGAFMILANLQMIPFTGRNVYLLAAFSGSDWVEGMALYGLALWLLGRSETGPVSVKGKPGR